MKKKEKGEKVTRGALKICFFSCKPLMTQGETENNVHRKRARKYRPYMSIEIYFSSRAEILVLFIVRGKSHPYMLIPMVIMPTCFHLEDV